MWLKVGPARCRDGTLWSPRFAPVLQKNVLVCFELCPCWEGHSGRCFINCQASALGLMTGHVLGLCDQAGNDESQSFVFTLPSAGIHSPASKHLGVWSGEMDGALWLGTWKLPGRNSRSRTMAGGREGPRAVMMNPKDLSMSSPTEKGNYSPEHPKTSSRVWKGQSLSKQLCCLLAFHCCCHWGGKALTAHGGQSTAQGCAQGEARPSCYQWYSARLRSPCPPCTCFSC